MAAQKPAAMDIGPYMDRVMTEFKAIKDCCPGKPDERFAWNPVSTTEMDECINTGISYALHEAACHDSMAMWFDRDNIGLPGMVLHCKTMAVDKRNLAWRYIDFNNKRGGAAKIPAIGAPPVEWHSTEMSDVTHCWLKMLAHSKVAYQLTSEGYKLATQKNDAHAADFWTNLARYYSNEIITLGHQVSTLKNVDRDKGAIKEFDRELQKQMVPTAVMAGMEATLPNRLVIGAHERLTRAVNSCLSEDVMKDVLGKQGKMLSHRHTLP